ncbi:MAG: aminotransferase class I/II-fold pyridoxal phosphate-dependent enzyme [Acidimicrobiia bacterium]|nr:aminotransferase class I/II-fold pyridoxal phosphate-dependent enzyme [Acidimicrobiia bacterium]
MLVNANAVEVGRAVQFRFDGPLHLGVQVDVHDGAAGTAHEVVVVAPELFRQFEVGVAGANVEAADRAGLLEHGEGPIDRTLGHLRRARQDFRNGQRSACVGQHVDHETVVGREPPALRLEAQQNLIVKVVSIGQRHARERTVAPGQDGAERPRSRRRCHNGGVRSGEPDDGAGGRHDGVADRVDEPAKRAGGNLKWGIDPPGVLPAWIAEHDLGPPPVVRHALRRLADLPDVGYSRRAEELGQAFCDWAAQRHGWRPDPALVVPTADVLQGIWAVVAAFSAPGDGVISTPPVYPYFHDVAPELDRRSLECPLRHDADGWRLDLDDLAALLAREPAARVLLLCSPHNPTGHLYSREDLQAIAELTHRHDVLLVSDEIHFDLVYPDGTHCPTLALPEAAGHTVALYSAGKAFAISGLRAAVAVFGNEDLHDRFNEAMPPHLLGGVGRAGVEAAITAWRHGAGWLDDLVALFDRHRQMVLDVLAAELPDVGCHLPASTFLAWLDLSACELGPHPAARLVETARVRTSEGREFGTGGAGHVRLNFGTSTVVLAEILDRLVGALRR